MICFLMHGKPVQFVDVTDILEGSMQKLKLPGMLGCFNSLFAKLQELVYEQNKKYALLHCTEKFCLILLF